MDQDELPVADMAALREAVLGFYEDSVRFLVVQPSGRVPRRPPRRRLQWLKLLLLPALLVGLVRMVITGRAREALVRQQRAVSLYRQLSGKDPWVAEAEVRRVKDQLMAIDQRIKPYGDSSRTAGMAARAELAAAADALLAYHLAGRQTDDVLLGELGWPDVPALRGVMMQVIRDGVDLGVRTREQVGLGALSPERVGRGCPMTAFPRWPTGPASP